MISALFAIDSKGGMGFQGTMPWPLNKDDMKFFKSITTGQTVVMGRKTWDSPDMPSPLPNRRNLLFTSTFLERNDIVQANGDVCETLRFMQTEDSNEIFVIGGANLIQQAKPVIDRVFLTRIPGEYQCDTFIDVDDFLSGFNLVETHNLGSCQVEEYKR
jgi:dihydrofolate reductase